MTLLPDLFEFAYVPMKREALSKAEIKMPDPVIDMEKSPLAFAEHSIEENMTSWLKSLLKE